MKDEIKKILDKFDKVLENYELDKKFGQMSVDSICHLFPNEMIIIKDYITNLQEENERIARAINYNIKIEEKYCHAAFFDDELSSVAYKIAEDNIKMLLYGGKVDNE